MPRGRRSWSAFAVATLTACSYLELVTKYPQAAGAALYTHKAFGIHFVTFLVAFAVMCSGITRPRPRPTRSPGTCSTGFDLGFEVPGGTGDHRCSRWASCCWWRW